MNILKLMYGPIIENYYFISISLFLLFFITCFYIYLNKISKITSCNIDLIDKINATNKLKVTDKKYYDILYNTYVMIGSSINIEKSEIFDEKYLLNLNEAKNIFYGVKRNKNLIKSNYLLLKIFHKINLYEIDKSEIDNTIIYLILLVLNKKK